MQYGSCITYIEVNERKFSDDIRTVDIGGGRRYKITLYFTRREQCCVRLFPTSQSLKYRGADKLYSSIVSGGDLTSEYCHGGFSVSKCQLRVLQVILFNILLIEQCSIHDRCCPVEWSIPGIEHCQGCTEVLNGLPYILFS